MKHYYCLIMLLFVGRLTYGQMMFGDTTRIGRPFSKDPHVVNFKGDYYMYFSVPSPENKGEGVEGWGIGIAKSKDLKDWKKVGEITPQDIYEQKGLCAPGALVRNDTIHLFYQTYGNWKEDAICHAWSLDGVHFTRNVTNPVFRPTGAWNCGRAIDAEVVFYGGKYLLYFATRTPDMRKQIMGVAEAPVNTSFNKDQWTQLSTKSIMEPEYPWEGNCTEGASVIEKNGQLFMFYAGAYNNRPQQIGVAVSQDGIEWKKLSNKPFLANGDAGEWNSSESGHPHIFLDQNGLTYLFYQGNNDNGRTWYISNLEVFWSDKGPFLKDEK